MTGVLVGEYDLGVHCFSLSPPRRRPKVNDVENTSTCMRALNVPLLHSASDPGCIEKDQKKVRRRSTGSCFEDTEIKCLRRNKGIKFGCEKRTCMNPIEKELPPLRESESPLKERQTAHRKLAGQSAHYQSLRSCLSDETRDQRISLLHETRQSPGPGEYTFVKPQFGAAFCGGPPAVSRLQCFGSTESRGCMTEKKSPRCYKNCGMRPRADNEVQKYFATPSSKICKGLAVKLTLGLRGEKGASHHRQNANAYDFSTTSTTAGSFHSPLAIPLAVPSSPPNHHPHLALTNGDVVHASSSHNQRSRRLMKDKDRGTSPTAAAITLDSNTLYDNFQTLTRGTSQHAMNNNNKNNLKSSSPKTDDACLADRGGGAPGNLSTTFTTQFYRCKSLEQDCRPPPMAPNSSPLAITNTSGFTAVYDTYSPKNTGATSTYHLTTRPDDRMLSSHLGRGSNYSCAQEDGTSAAAPMIGLRSFDLSGSGYIVHGRSENQAQEAPLLS